MRIHMVCVGRLKDGPERQLVDDYLARARRIGGQLGWRDISEIEVASGGGMTREGERLLDRLGAGIVVRLDEIGRAATSEKLSADLASWRDDGREVDFIIGGADGTSEAIAARADRTISFGTLTWPHKLVRVMLAEQIYRAVSIEAGTPYHRE